MVRNGFGPRCVAALIDGVVMLVVMIALNTVIFMVIGRTLAGVMVAGIVSGGAALAYTSLEVLRAGSFGKMCMGLTITCVDGSPAPRELLLKRWVAKNAPTIFHIGAAVTTVGLLTMVGGLVGLVFFVGCFLALQPEKMALHDKLLGTAVFGPEKLTFTVPTMSQIMPAAAHAPPALAAAPVHVPPKAA